MPPHHWCAGDGGALIIFERALLVRVFCVRPFLWCGVIARSASSRSGQWGVGAGWWERAAVQGRTVRDGAVEWRRDLPGLDRLHHEESRLAVLIAVHVLKRIGLKPDAHHAVLSASA